MNKPFSIGLALLCSVALAQTPATTQRLRGTVAVTGADGTLSALEVLVFPEAARGSGEGRAAT